MNHKVGFNKLGLKTSHRKALHRNMAISLFRYERVTTTKAKALAVRRTVEKMITRAKVDSVHNRRIVGRDIKDKEILAKLFNEIAPRYVGRPGGYTRVLKLGWRQGDAAETVLLELVNEDSPAKTGKKKKTSKNSKPVAKESSEAVEAKVATEKEAEEVKTDATEKDVVNQEAGDSSKPDVEEASSLEKDE